jgi:hypothetical protein
MNSITALLNSMLNPMFAFAPAFAPAFLFVVMSLLSASAVAALFGKVFHARRTR